MKLDILKARQFFADFFYGEHHLPGLIKKCGEGWSIAMSDELATSDYNEMTRLVLMAHERCIRVSVRPLNFKHIKLCIHARDPFSNSLTVGHPSIDEAIERHENFNKNHLSKYKINPNQSWSVEMPRDVPVFVFDLEGNKVDEFPSQTACGESLGVSRQAINRGLVRGSVIKEKYKVSLTE